MPRTRQGGPRTATPGQQYTNRSDLQQRALPVKAAPGQVYGQAAAQEQAQKAVPMAPPPSVAPAPSQAPLGGGIAPGAFGDLHRPTERPMEPVTAGAALGPGPGVEALGAPLTSSMSNVSSLLQRAAAATGSNVLNQMAQRASAVGQ